MPSSNVGETEVPFRRETSFVLVLISPASIWPYILQSLSNTTDTYPLVFRAVETSIVTVRPATE
jgi:hypothetical protein